MTEAEQKPGMLFALWRSVYNTDDGSAPDQARYIAMMKLGFPIGLLAHLFYVCVFWANGYSFLVAFNVLSVLLFGLGTWLTFQGRASFGATACLLLEVPVHGVLATAYLGFEAGFWLPVFITVAMYILYPNVSRIVRLVICFGLVVVVATVVVFVSQRGAIYDVSFVGTSLFFIMNMLVVALIVVATLVSYEVAVDTAERAKKVEFDRAEALLLNILPHDIATRLKADEQPLADEHAEVSVLFADLSGFTNLSRGLTPQQLVTVLNDLFTRFDAIAARFGAEKIKTIGDAYMAATGLRDGADHAARLADMALEMHVAFDAFQRGHKLDLGLRIGMHSGRVIAGVIGQQKFSYDLWGDTVNVASRMESTGAPGQVHVSDEIRALLPARFALTPRGDVEIKGHAPRACFFLAHA